MAKLKVSEIYGFENKDGDLSLGDYLRNARCQCPIERQDKSYSRGGFDHFSFITCYPLNGKIQRIIVDRGTKTKEANNIFYDVSRTHVIPIRKGPRKPIVSIFESTRHEGTCNVTVVSYGKTSLEEAESIARYLGLLSL